MRNRDSLFDTLTGEPQDPLDEDWNGLFAACDAFVAVAELLGRESDPPPDEPPPAAALAA
jgi:hypothetical protein